ncbi:hypothetical protein PHET_02377 [Paragonimus heterotremus]|uniref:PLAT domain-containing protein n=1 Tax=Paragonimus heterotremus TaxID=100268 RepID=A0A8J4TD95_9TREM|nr:hypothetical protein PHET_02377 [Paragonimus heterotremus]
MVVTGDQEGCGTDSNVFITIYGRTGITPRIELARDKSSDKSIFHSPFARGLSTKFVVKAPSVGALTRLRISQNASGQFPHWYLERIVITDMTYPKWTYYFNCSFWLSPNYADGKLSRLVGGFRESTGMGIGAEYRLTFYTADKPGAGTTADVFVQFYGEAGISREIWLNTPPWIKQSDKEPKVPIKFDRGSCVQVAFPPCQQYGQLKQLKVGHNNHGHSPRWFLEKVIVDDLKQHRVYEFPCHNWIDSPNEIHLHCTRAKDRSASPKKWKKVPFIFMVFTGDLHNAGTTANVFIRLRGPEQTDHLASTSKKRTSPVRRKSAQSDTANSVNTISFNEESITKEFYSTPCIWLSDGTYERKRISEFRIDLPVPFCISPIAQLDIGHDNSGKSPSWHLEKTLSTKQVIVDCPTTGLRQTFLCGRWLARNEDDGKTERTLIEDLNQRKINKPQIPWLLSVKTSKLPNAATSAKVTLALYGSLGKTEDLELDRSLLDDQSNWLPASSTPSESRLFEKGAEDVFRVNFADVGVLYKLRISHDNSGPNPQWHLEKVVLTNLNTEEQYLFFCNRWLSLTEDDHTTTQELPAHGTGILHAEQVCRYRVSVFTGNQPHAGTDAKVFINIFGEHGDTGDRWLLQPVSKKKPFQKHQMDEFIVEAVDLKRIKKIRIGHNSTHPGTGWFLSKVIIEKAENCCLKAIFDCHRWFDVGEDDGMVVRELIESSLTEDFVYRVTVQTGNLRFAGTDANIFIRLYGTHGETGSLSLKTSETHTNKFEAGSTDIFSLTGPDIGELQKLRIWHDGTGPGSSWFLDRVLVTVPHLGLSYEFAANRWLALNEADGKLSVQLEPTSSEKVEKTVPYEVVVFTGDCDAAETYSNVFIQFYGTPLNRKSDVIQLLPHSRRFDRGTVEKFKVYALNVGLLQKIQISHDGSGGDKGWYLNRILVRKSAAHVEEPPAEDSKMRRKQSQSRSQTALRNLSNSRESLNTLSDGSQLSSPRLLQKDGPLKEIVDDEGMENYWFIVNEWLSKQKGDRQVLTAIGIGPLQKVKLRHDGNGLSSSWFVDYVAVKERTFNRTQEYLFPCYQWFARDRSDGLISRELVAASQLILERWKEGKDIRADARLLNADRSTSFVIRIHTGKDMCAGTDAKVHIELFGEKESTGIIPLKTSRDESGSKKANKFEAGSMDIFTVKAIDIGPLQKIHIGHDCSGAGPSWKLDRVEIDAPKLNLGWTFLCDQWITPIGHAKYAEVELYPKPELTKFLRSTMTFEATVHTSDLSSPAMSASVHMQIYGRNGEKSQAIPLRIMEEDASPFKREAIDVFYVEIEELPLPISKVRIWHDEKGICPHWHLRRIELRHLTPNREIFETYLFPCERWLSRSKEDMAVERELVPSKLFEEDQVHHKLERNVPEHGMQKHYEIHVVTGKEVHAGTDAKVFLTLYGTNGDSGERRLAKSKTHSNKFEAGHTDVFEWEVVDLGKLQKAHIRHDNTGPAPAWFLARIEVYSWDAGQKRPGTGAGKQASTSAEQCVLAGPTIFHCERWLSSHHEDCRTERVLYADDYHEHVSISSVHMQTDNVPPKRHRLPSGMLIFPRKMDRTAAATEHQFNHKEDSTMEDGALPTMPYHVRVVTGSMKQAGTPGPVWIRCCGKGHEESGKLMLFDERQGTALRKGTTTNFYFDAPTIEDLTEVEVCNEAITSTETGWFLRHLQVDLVAIGRCYQFSCNTWLSRKRGDGKTLRCFPVSNRNIITHSKLVTYHVAIETSNVEHAGTDSNVYLQLVGRMGTSNERIIEKAGNLFERGSQDMFALEFENVGELLKVRIRHDANGDRKHWKIENVEVADGRCTYNFSVVGGLWLSTKYGETKKLWADLVATRNGVEQLRSVTLKILTKTSNQPSSGTDCGVFIRLFGEYGDSGDLQLKTTVNKQLPFKPNAVDEFVFSKLLDVGTLSRCRLWHDNNGRSTSWFCEWLEVQESLEEGVPRPSRHWRFDCNKWLSNKEADHQIRVDLPCSEEFMNDPVRGRLSDQLTIRTLLAIADVSTAVNLLDAHVGDIAYEVELKTGSRKEAGTTYNCWLLLEGSEKHSRKLVVTNTEHKPVLQTGQTDHFRLLSPPIGKLTKLKLGLLLPKVSAKLTTPSPPTSSRHASDWFCESVVVLDPVSRQKYLFKVNKWIDANRRQTDWNETTIDVTEVQQDPTLLAVTSMKEKSSVKYKIMLHTGDKLCAGTDANVFVRIFGDQPGLDSGRIQLRKEGINLFERHHVDTFYVECVDLGKLRRLWVEHDHTGVSSDWFLAKVQVTNSSSGEMYNFPCDQWLSRKRGDARLWKELYAIVEYHVISTGWLWNDEHLLLTPELLITQLLT